MTAASGGAAAGGGARRRGDLEGEGANGNHGDAHQIAGKRMEAVGRAGAAGTAAIRRRSPSDGGGCGRKLRPSRAFPVRVRLEEDEDDTAVPWGGSAGRERARGAGGELGQRG